MKKKTALVLASLVVFVAGISYAEVDLSSYSVANGTVTASEWMDVVSPYSGTLKPFEVAPGDYVEEGEGIFELMTTDITAPEAGTVGGVFVMPGESAETSMRKYGAAAAILPAVRQNLSCTYSGAFEDDACKLVHLGERLYFKSNRSEKTEGEGIVVSVGERGFIVEITTGDFKLHENMGLFRSADYLNKEKVGTGRVVDRNDVTVGAMGVVAEVFVSPGDEVSSGDRLFSVMSADADIGSRPQVLSEAEGVVASVPVVSGQQVWKGQLLARIYPVGAAVVEADIDEMDLGELSVGDDLYVTFDTDADMIYNGKIEEISGLGHTKQNAAYYTVRIAVEDVALLYGQSASVYLPKTK